MVVVVGGGKGRLEYPNFIRFGSHHPLIPRIYMWSKMMSVQMKNDQFPQINENVLDEDMIWELNKGIPPLKVVVNFTVAARPYQMMSPFIPISFWMAGTGQHFQNMIFVNISKAS